jgi:hypothetical protein
MLASAIGDLFDLSSRRIRALPNTGQVLPTILNGKLRDINAFS